MGVGNWGQGWKETRSLSRLAVPAQAAAERRDLRWGSGEVSRQVLWPEGLRFRRGLRGGKTDSGARTGVSDTHPAPSEESRGTQWGSGPVLSTFCRRRERVGQLSRPWGLREPVGGIQSPGRRAGNPAKHPLPLLPALPRELRLPRTGAGPGASRTQGAATAPFVGFGWKLHPEAPLPSLRGFEVAPTLQGEAAGFAAGQKWGSP